MSSIRACGPLAPPGTYRVRLNAAGETKTQSFTVSRNPNVPGLTDADLQEQFSWARQIGERVSQVNAAVIRIRELKAQVNDRVAAVRAKEKGRNAPLAALQGVVEGGDGKLTEQSHTVFKALSQRLDAELAKLDTVVKTELPVFNKEIAKEKIEAVK
jgi:hypothetical protein